MGEFVSWTDIMRNTFILLALILGSSAVVHSKKVPTTPTLTFYQFDQFVSVPGAEATIISSASPTGNLSSFAFGNFGVGQHVLRESASNTSKVIGTAPVWISPNKEVGTFNIHGKWTLETEKYRGSIVFGVDDDFNQVVNEVAILGGTGSFRLARGYGLVTKIEATPEHGTYRMDLYLLLQQRL